ncbi:MAG: hypothetical protein Q9202_001694 [Teloschistes flavicans]
MDQPKLELLCNGEPVAEFHGPYRLPEGEPFSIRISFAKESPVLSENVSFGAVLTMEIHKRHGVKEMREYSAFFGIEELKPSGVGLSHVFLGTCETQDGKQIPLPFRSARPVVSSWNDSCLVVLTINIMKFHNSVIKRRPSWIKLEEDCQTYGRPQATAHGPSTYLKRGYNPIYYYGVDLASHAWEYQTNGKTTRHLALSIILQAIAQIFQVSETLDIEDRDLHDLTRKELLRPVRRLKGRCIELAEKCSDSEKTSPAISRATASDISLSSPNTTLGASTVTNTKILKSNATKPARPETSPSPSSATSSAAVTSPNITSKHDEANNHKAPLAPGPIPLQTATTLSPSQNIPSNPATNAKHIQCPSFPTSSAMQTAPAPVADVTNPAKRPRPSVKLPPRSTAYSKGVGGAKAGESQDIATAAGSEGVVGDETAKAVKVQALSKGEDDEEIASVANELGEWEIV